MRFSHPRLLGGTAGFSREGTGESVLLKGAAFLQKLAEQDGASLAALWEGSRPFLSQVKCHGQLGNTNRMSTVPLFSFLWSSAFNGEAPEGRMPFVVGKEIFEKLVIE